MSKELGTNITKTEVTFAVIAGALLGTGLFVPQLGGLGITVGAIGVIRMDKRRQDTQMREFLSYLSDAFNKNKPQ